MSDDWADEQAAELQLQLQLAELFSLDETVQAEERAVIAGALRAAYRRGSSELVDVLDVLQQIAAIKNKTHCGDWDEIEEARALASAALEKKLVEKS